MNQKTKTRKYKIERVGNIVYISWKLMGYTMSRKHSVSNLCDLTNKVYTNGFVYRYPKYIKTAWKQFENSEVK
jgi:hypothetical protein